MPRLQSTLKIVGSMRVTIVLLLFSMMLTFLATMAQTQLGIWEVMSRYIRTFLVWHEVPGIGLAPIFPGGWTLGGLLLINLLAAHMMRFRLTWRYVPLLLIHAGIALLLLSEWVTGVYAREMNLMFDEGQTKAYTEHPRETEFIVVDVTDPAIDRVYAVHEGHIARGKPFSHEELPFRVETRRFFQNSRVFLLPEEALAMHPDEGMADQGLGPRLRIAEEPRVVSTDGRNLVSAVVEVVSREGRALGTWAVSSALTEPQTFVHEGRTYAVAIRPERTYLGYSLELLKFTHLRYPGTTIPMHFASDVRLHNPATGEVREVQISMNQPLRYQGKTFYQASYANNDQTSILQVVRNPGWTLPYIACLAVTVGILWQLGARVGSGGRRRRAAAAADPGAKVVPMPGLGLAGWTAMVVAGAWICAGLLAVRTSDTRPDLDGFGALPVHADGRLKAVDSMARGYLRALSGKTTVRTPEGARMDAREWFLAVSARPDIADRLPVFTIFHPEVMTLLGQETASRLTLAFEEIRPHGAHIQRHAELARKKDRADRSTFEEAVLQLDYLVTLYWRLRHSYHLESVADLGAMILEHEQEVYPVFARMRGMSEGGVPDEILGRLHNTVVRYGILEDFAQFAPVPYGTGQGSGRGEWVTMGEGFQRSLQADALHPAVPAYHGVLRAWHDGNISEFNASVDELQGWMAAHFPAAAHRAGFESVFNRLDLFWKGAALYVFVFLLVALSWVAGPRWLALANGLCWLTWTAHTIGLVMRMYIQERPPVTSLHASALFVGWAAVLIGLVVERRLRNGLGLAGAAGLGFLTLVIAHNLGGDGDTVEVMRAVLNSNFWLATHVVVITIGYSAVFIAGALGIAYLVARRIPAAWTPELRRKLTTTMLGVVGFALLFSFAGTVLGGIWADQSWGRFWGWDPKENGALLIVIWMAVILHLRIGGIGDERMLMVCAVFGNIIVAFSWFGVNMLGVGLHAYGFMEGAPFWLGLFMVSQLGIMALGALPAAAEERTPSGAS